MNREELKVKRRQEAHRYRQTKQVKTGATLDELRQKELLIEKLNLRIQRQEELLAEAREHLQQFNKRDHSEEANTIEESESYRTNATTGQHQPSPVICSTTK